MDKTPGSPRNDASAASTPPNEEPQSPASPDLNAVTRKEKGRVRFNSIAGVEPPSFLDISSGFSASQSRHESPSFPSRPRPSVLRGNSYNSVTSIPESVDNDDLTSEKAMSAHAAQHRAQQVAAGLLGSRSAPGSARTSLDSEADTVNSGNAGEVVPGFANPPLEDFAIPVPDINVEPSEKTEKARSRDQRMSKIEARNLVQSHTQRHTMGGYPPAPTHTALSSGQLTPIDGSKHELYIPAPSEYRPSVLSNLLKLYKPETSQSPNYAPSRKSEAGSEFTTPGSSGVTTPNRRKWYEKNRSQDTLANLVEASARLASAGVSGPAAGSSKPKRPKHRRSPSGRMLSFGRPRIEDEIRITMHIAETLTRQKYIIKMCKALMLYGAPTHRLEEYLRMTARVLEIDGQFLYLPGCMIISFDDRSTHTTEVKIVRANQGIDLGKLRDVHEIYKLVLHDKLDLEEAINSLSTVMEKKDKFHAWVRVLVFGLASATVAPFAFDGQFIDLPICFFLGCLVGTLQIIVAPKSDLYNNVFEISAAVLTSFLSRAFGSIQGGTLFCFSSLAQSSIALILPGWFVRKYTTLLNLMYV